MAFPLGFSGYGFYGNDDSSAHYPRSAAARQDGFRENQERAGRGHHCAHGRGGRPIRRRRGHRRRTRFRRLALPGRARGGRAVTAEAVDAPARRDRGRTGRHRGTRREVRTAQRHGVQTRSAAGGGRPGGAHAGSGQPQGDRTAVDRRRRAGGRGPPGTARGDEPGLARLPDALQRERIAGAHQGPARSRERAKGGGADGGGRSAVGHCCVVTLSPSG
uniref:Uncharacterized protein n=1 Tax=Mycolicibacterium smegmatis TaxID=1772 RepID=Q7WTY3_MYCSM|nr:unknown [Mycolicibacterium smegmatis]